MIGSEIWDGGDLSGYWEVTIKIDGVLAKWNGEQWLSRSFNPLHNIPEPWPGGPVECEVYLGSFDLTISATRTIHLTTETPAIKREHLYSLDPIDERLRASAYTDLDAATIRDLLADAVATGYEGLVLRQGTHWIKVKPEATYDVRITGVIEGRGKLKGHIGAFVTTKGKVGIFRGVDHKQRADWWSEFEDTGGEAFIADTIEVGCLGLTKNGKFRHGRYIRFRPDKIASE